MFLCLTSITSAQEEAATSTSTDETEGLEEPESIDSGSSVVQAGDVYRLEGLLGDKVFNDFVLGPGKVDLRMEPGETKIIELNVSNRYDESKVFGIDIEDMAGSNNLDRAVVLLGDDKGPYSLRDYISVPAERFELAPNTRAIVPVTISIPPDAEPGGLYGSVLLQTVTRKAQASSGDTRPQSAIVSRIGTLFFITVPGEVEEDGSLVDFSTINNQKFYENGPINFQILYENAGSVHLNPYGEVRITNMFDEEVGFVELEPWFSMPDSMRLREVSWNRDFLYGQYKAVLKLNRGYDDLVDETEITFWVIPWKIGLGIFAGFFVFFLLIRSFFRSFEFKRKR